MSTTTTRVFWSEDECILLLNIIEEKNILKLIDGRKFRKNEIYKIVENEFLERGIADKSAHQIENKWKNLKKMYITTKKNNSVSGASASTCDYYEKLDSLLGTRPSVSNLFHGIDAAEAQSLDPNDLTNDPANEECDTPPPSKKKKGCESKKQQPTETGNDSGNLLTEFLQKSNELVEYEVQCFDELETKKNKEFIAAMRDIFVETNQMFFRELRHVINENTEPQPSTSSSCNSGRKSPVPGCSNNLEDELFEFINFK